MEQESATPDALTVGWTAQQVRLAKKYLNSHFRRNLVEQEAGSSLVAFPTRTLEVVRGVRLTNALEIEIYSQEARDTYLPPIADLIVTSHLEAN